jgi:hypothetical protein
MTDQFFQHLTDANRGFVDQIRVADQKAAYVFTFILALVVWSAETRRALNFQTFIAANPLTQAISLLLLVSLLSALCSAICVVLPRSRPGTSVLYWGAWPDAGTRLKVAWEAQDPRFIEQDLMQNTRTLAIICRAKYQLVRFAFRSLLVAVMAYVMLLILPS